MFAFTVQVTGLTNERSNVVYCSGAKVSVFFCPYRVVFFFCGRFGSRPSLRGILAFKAASRPDDRFQSAGGGAPSGLWMEEVQAVEHQKFESCGALLAGGARCEDIGAATDDSRSGGCSGTLRGAAVCAGRSGHDEIAIFGITRADERCARSITK